MNLEEALNRYDEAIASPDLVDWQEVAAELAHSLALAIAPKCKPDRRVSVVEFLRARGGVIDQGGELRAMSAHRLRPGLVNNRRGLQLDRARELLVEAGYLHEGPDDQPARTTVNDVLELIDKELSGQLHFAGELPF